jgi:excisionase family DNA binding protein
MNRKEIDLLLARIEGLKSFLEKNSLEDFQKEILRVDNYLKRFGSLDELLSHHTDCIVTRDDAAAKEFLTIDEVAYYLQVSKSYVYKLTASREFTVYKPNGKTIFVRRDDLNEWIRRNPCVSGREIESRANLLAYRLEQQQKPRTFKK